MMESGDGGLMAPRLPDETREMEERGEMEFPRMSQAAATTTAAFKNEEMKTSEATLKGVAVKIAKHLLTSPA